MTQEQLTRLSATLRQRVGADEDVTSTDLEQLIEGAEQELCLYLNRESVPVAMHCKVLELAALVYQRRCAAAEHSGIQSASYSEGTVSQSVTYLSADGYESAKQKTLSSVAHFRRRVTI